MNLVVFIVFLATLASCSALECYVCENQQNNHEKCLNTIKTCEQGEDTCLTEVRWGTMPYWQQGAEKQYYVSKKCATRDICERTRARYMPFCTYIWYEDWRCSHCCQGDRCNYYAILGASSTKTSIGVMIGGLLAAVAWQRLHL